MDAAARERSRGRGVGALGPPTATVVVPPDEHERDAEGVGQEPEVIGLEVAAADDGVEGAKPLPVGRMLEGRIRVVRHGQPADRGAASSGERRRVGPVDGQPSHHGSSPVGRAAPRGVDRRLGLDPVAHQSRLLDLRRERGDRLGPALAGRDELGHRGVDPDLTGVEREGHAIVAVLDPVAVAVLDDVDRRQVDEPLVGTPQPLPAGAPVLATERLERQEVAAALRAATDRRTPDVGDVDGPQADLDGSGAPGVRVELGQRGEWPGTHPAHTPDPSAGQLAERADRGADGLADALDDRVGGGLGGRPQPGERRGGGRRV